MTFFEQIFIYHVSPGSAGIRRSNALLCQQFTISRTNKFSGMTIHYDSSSWVALITISRPPVNSLNQATRRALLTALNRALDDPDADAIVIWGGPQIFSAGAD